ncbi:ATP-binding protein [Streptomyces sp. HPF1205]|uniref:ATP-binding protein n=1 Tax=Streptomyces sp. HPF1205 TaxID=2873262 RepID=UPI001CED7764|nr:ATP-binding protein [Streptomyces sp. HPF1205]
MRRTPATVSELVTNAIAHAHPPYGRLIATRLERLERGVRIEVHDADAGRRPERQEVCATSESGRGLALVDILTRGNWGVGDRKGPGKIVWAVCAEDPHDARA